jgi:hypothetical protein
MDAKEEVKDEDDEILNPLDMDVEDDEDLLVGLSLRVRRC